MKSKKVSLIFLFIFVFTICVISNGCKSKGQSASVGSIEKTDTVGIEQKETYEEKETTKAETGGDNEAESVDKELEDVSKEMDETTGEETSETVSEEATEETSEESFENPDKTFMEKEEKSDGSIYIKVTDKDGKLLQTVEYKASSDSTIKYAYEYNEKGYLATEYDFEGPGNLIDEFLEGNYENATMSGVNSYDALGGYEVDLGAAFEVSIEELAPLYKKAEEIWDKYGVAVLIADKVSSYTSTAEPCYDYTKIKQSMELIEKCLECYPKGFFKEFSGKWVETTVCIQIVGTGGPAGLYLDGDEFKIVQIDVNDYCPEESADDIGAFLCYTLHHEIGHMISYTLLERAETSTYPLTEEGWNSFNPEGFEYAGGYDDDKESEIYCKGDNSEYFIYSYSCSTPEEDRAIIFGNAMNYYMGYEKMGFNDKVDAKLAYLSECIKSGFMGVEWGDETPAWEKILEHNAE